MAEEIPIKSLSEAENPTPVALSLAGGATGTIAGLKRRGVPGALIGALVGGTLGYLVGAKSTDAIHVEEPPIDSDPISIELGESTTTEGDADDRTHTTGSTEPTHTEESEDDAPDSHDDSRGESSS